MDSDHQASRNEKRQKIIEAALRAFSHRGFYRTRISDIAKDANVADGTVYLYFKSKEDLLTAIFDEFMERFLTTLHSDLKEIADIWQHFSGVPQELELPFAPKKPIVVKTEPDRPQPRKDRDLDKAMAVTVGGLKTCNVFDIRFVGLHHNTIRGAAGGAILTAELLQAGNYL